MPPNLLPERGSLLLALRGLLACDVLTHSLAKRHLVDYGVNRCGVRDAFEHYVHCGGSFVFAMRLSHALLLIRLPPVCIAAYSPA